MSDTEDNQQVEVITAKKTRNVKSIEENGKKSQLIDTVKVGQNRKEAPKKKRGSQEEAVTPTLADQKKLKKGNKKGGAGNEEEKQDEQSDEGETCEITAKENTEITDQKAKGGAKGGKKDAKNNNKFKYSDNDYQILIQYLQDANKPFNCTTLESNLKAKTNFKKGSIEVALQQGVDEGKLVKKAYGNSIVYWNNQDLLPSVSKDEIEILTESILKKQTEISELNSNLRNFNTQLTKIMQEKTDEQMQQEIERYILLIQKQEEEYNFYSSEQFIPEDVEVVKLVEEKLSKIESICKKRKRICEDAVKELIENLEETKNIAQMFEVIGIDDGQQ